jgi:hypothetical protein
MLGPTDHWSAVLLLLLRCFIFGCLVLTHAYRKWRLRSRCSSIHSALIPVPCIPRSPGLCMVQKIQTFLLVSPTSHHKEISSAVPTYHTMRLDHKCSPSVTITSSFRSGRTSSARMCSVVAIVPCQGHDQRTHTSACELCSKYLTQRWNRFCKPSCGTTKISISLCHITAKPTCWYAEWYFR